MKGTWGRFMLFFLNYGLPLKSKLFFLKAPPTSVTMLTLPLTGMYGMKLGSLKKGVTIHNAVSN